MRSSDWSSDVCSSDLVGRPIADLSRWALSRLPPGGDLESALQRRLAFMRAGSPHLTKRVMPDGSIVEIRGNPMPGGGFVATYTDVTEFRSVERGLRRANETLEQRVGERTALLESAKREAEHANDATSRFLTAIGHDLMQPLHARSEEHTSELQSLMRISYAVFCLKTKTTDTQEI